MKKIILLVVFVFTTLSNAQIKEGSLLPGSTSVLKTSFEENKTQVEDVIQQNTMSTSSFPTGNSSEVGVTEGQLSISLNGAANYSIPLIIPPGINGIEPQISLNYNSQRGDGLAGYGWSIKGISIISRIPSTQFHDGIIDPVDFDSYDRFALDGERLIVKNGGIYGADGTIYETENYSNLKITSYGIHPLGSSFGPAYFKVEYPDGSFSIYGNSSDSRTVIDWGINYSENLQGIRINYEYGNVADEALTISKISYGSLANASPINSIEFDYSGLIKSHPEIATYYIPNVAVIRLNRTKLLNKIVIKGNGVPFKNYELLYDSTDLNYNRLIKITEKTGDNQLSYNPTVFTYENTPDTISTSTAVSSLSVGGVDYTNSKNVTGDFNGDGKMDFIVYATTGTNAKKWFTLFDNLSGQGVNMGWYSGIITPFEEIFATTWLSWNNKVMPQQGITLVQKDTSIAEKVNFNTYYDAPGIAFQYAKSVTFPNANDKKYFSGDFNGDGLSDIIAIEKSSTNGDSKVFFVDLDRRNTTNFFSYVGQLNYNAFQTGTEIYVIDFDGDGKSDIINFCPNVFSTVYSLNVITNQMEKVYQHSDGIVFSSNTILIGDYNGDGKTDFMRTNTQIPNEFKLFTSTGNAFTAEYKIYPFSYRVNDNIYSYTLIPNDYNNDGKTDITAVTTARYSLFLNTIISGNAYGYITIDNYKNTGSTFVSGSSATIGKNAGNPSSSNPGSPAIKRYPSPIFLNSNNPNLNQSLAFISDSSVYNFNSNKDFSKESLLKKITNGNGVEENITYSPLISLGCVPYCTSLRAYSIDYSSAENYPNTNIDLALNFKVVSKISKNGLVQDYGYFGAVSNLQGLGFLGFKGIAKTNFYNNIDIPAMTKVSIFDTALRGAVIIDYTSVGSITSFNAQLDDYSFKNVYKYNTYDGITFDTTLLGNKVFKLKNTIKESINLLEGTSILETKIFDNYNNITKTTSLIKQGNTVQKTILSEMEYDNAPSAVVDYHIGRPINIKQTATVGSSVVKSEEQYSYGSGNSAGLITQSLGFVDGNNTNTITETNNYDIYGNLIQKTISGSDGTTRTKTFFYDDTPSTNYGGRFLTKSTDVEGLSVNYTYNPNNGLLVTQSSPYSTIANPIYTKFYYDLWGKKTLVENYFGTNVTNSTTYSYLNNLSSGNYYMISQTDNDGSESKIFFDLLDKPIVNGVKDINGMFSYNQILYDALGREVKVSDSYYSTDSPPLAPSSTLWSQTEYDGYGRVIKNVDMSGKITTVSYLGLTTTINDTYTTTVTTRNATGTTASVTDTGGTIVYDYYANDNLKSTNCEGSSIFVEYNGWGLKTKLTDSSAGVYQYEYNLLGEIKKEITPIGTTIYGLNSVGKINYSSSYGPNTHQNTDYFYDPVSKLPTMIESYDTYTGEAYATMYTYDAQKRLKKTTEFSMFAEYEIDFEYDAFGRVDREYRKQSHFATGKSTSKWIKNKYRNGYHHQILDDVDNKVLWQLNAVNARGQVLTTRLGNSITINNTYDQYGFPIQSVHDKSGLGIPITNIITLNTNFNTQKGNLLSRYNSLFNRTDDFQYDTLDRLTHYPNHLGQTDEQTYETDGRIKQNVLGTYEYLNSGKKYQNSRIKAEANVIPYYDNRAGIFNDDFEKKSGWAIYEPTVVTYDDTTAKTGTTSLKIHNTGTGEKVVHSEVWTKINNAVATQYTYSGWVKSTGPQAEMFLFMKTENETGYFTQVDQIITSAGSNWVYFQKTVSVPANIKKLSLRLDNNGTGTVWFDDVRIRKTANTLTAARELNITYNMFKGPVEIEETNVDRISFEYNHMNQRGSMFYGGLQADKLQRQYRKHYSADGSMEIKHNTITGEVEFVTYIGGDGYSAPLVLKSDGTTQEYLYLHRDYQGSILAITNQSGAVVEKRLFDAWGEVLRVEDGQGNVLAGFAVLDRGYTGHEHLQSVGLIHMNGRLYDAKLHRFLQPDNFIQDPTNTQNYNRYSYVLNNPLKYTDISGENYENGNGSSDLEDAGWAGLIRSAFHTINENWDDWGIKDWAKGVFNMRNISNSVRRAGNYVENQIRDFGRDVRGWFGISKGGSRKPIIIYTNQFSGPLPSSRGIETGNYMSSDNYSRYGDIHMPTQHTFLGVNMTALSEGNFLEQTFYETANSFNIVGQYLMGRGVGDSSMRNLNGTATTTGEGTMGFVGAGSSALGSFVASLKGAKTAFLNLGKTFSQYRTGYWANRVKPTYQPIRLQNGKVFNVYQELHHRFIPQRAKWAPNWLKNNRFNLQELNTIQHGLRDPYRFRFFPKEIKDAINNGHTFGY